MEGLAISGGTTSQHVAFGGAETINLPARDEYDGKTKRLPSRGDSIRAKPGAQWQEDAA